MTYQGRAVDTRGAVWSTATVVGNRLRTISAGSPASTAWPANNQAFLIPFLVAAPVTFAEMFFVTGTTPGTTNFDLGLYGDNFLRIASLGATACVNTNSSVMPAGGGSLATPVTLSPGRYFLAMSAASTTLTVAAHGAGLQIPRALGMYQMATAHPLPSTFVPASMSTSLFIPHVGATTITNIQ